MKPASEVAADWDKKFSVLCTEAMNECIRSHSTEIYVLMREVCPFLDMMLVEEKYDKPLIIEVRERLARMLRVIDGEDSPIMSGEENIAAFGKRFRGIAFDLYQALQILRDDNWEYYLKEGNAREQILSLLDYVDNGTDFFSFVSQHGKMHRQTAMADKVCESLEAICKVYDGEMQPVIEHTRRSFTSTLHLMELLVFNAKKYLAHIDGTEEQS